MSRGRERKMERKRVRKTGKNHVRKGKGTPCQLALAHRRDTHIRKRETWLKRSSACKESKDIPVCCAHIERDTRKDKETQTYASSLARCLRRARALSLAHAPAHAHTRHLVEAVCLVPAAVPALHRLVRRPARKQALAQLHRCPHLLVPLCHVGMAVFALRHASPLPPLPRHRRTCAPAFAVLLQEST